MWPSNTEWSRAKTNSVLPRKCTGRNKHPLPTTQERTLHMDITRWSTLNSDWLYSLQPKMEKLYTVSKNKTWSWLCAQILNLLPKSESEDSLLLHGKSYSGQYLQVIKICKCVVASVVIATISIGYHHNKHPLPTTQERTLRVDLTRWSTMKSDWLYSLQPKMEKLYLVSKSKTGSWWWLGSWTPYCQIQTEIEESRENH